MKDWGRVALGALRRGGWCGRCLVVLVALLVLGDLVILVAGAGNSSTWAAPCADSLRQTVSTRTPVQPTRTPVQPTVTLVQSAVTLVQSATETLSTSTPVPSSPTSAPAPSLSIQVSPTSPPLLPSPTSASIEAATAIPTSTQEPSPRVSASVTGASVPVNRTLSGQVSTQTPGAAKPRVSRSATPPSGAVEVGNGGEGKAAEMWLYWIVVLLAVAVTFGYRLHRK